MLEEVLEQYQEGFNDELGLLKGATAKIYTDQEASPKFCKPRPVPYTLCKKVEDELERLQKQGIIEPVQFSDWAAPIVFLIFKTSFLWQGKKLLRSSTFLILISKLS